MSQIAITNYTQLAEQVVQDYLKKMPSGLFIEVLRENTDRVQGSLVLFGYELEGGKDSTMIDRAALAIELFHAYAICMEQGVDIDRALRVAHEAEIILANLNADPEYRLKAVSITNRTMMLAAMARDPQAAEKDVTYWKSTELALNPLHVGQVLAGADCDRTNAVTEAALTLGEKLLHKDQTAFEAFLHSKF